MDELRQGGAVTGGPAADDAEGPLPLPVEARRDGQRRPPREVSPCGRCRRPPTGPLLAWLLDALRPMNRTRVKQLLRYGRVTVNGAPTTRFDHPLRAGDRVAIADAAARPGRRHPRQAGIARRLRGRRADRHRQAGRAADRGHRGREARHRVRPAQRPPGGPPGRPAVRRPPARPRHLGAAAVRPQPPPSATASRRAGTAWRRPTSPWSRASRGRPRGWSSNFLTEGNDLRVRASAGPRPGAKRAVTRYRVVAARGRSGSGRGRAWRRAGSTRSASTWRGSAARSSATRCTGRRPTRPGGSRLHAWRLAFDHPVTGRRVELESPLPAELRLG